MTLKAVPRGITEKVSHWVDSERADWKRYDNRSPMDGSGVYSLHRLAAEIYEQAWADGHDSARVEERDYRRAEEVSDV